MKVCTWPRRRKIAAALVAALVLALALAAPVAAAFDAPDATTGWRLVAKPTPDVVTTVSRTTSGARTVWCWKDPWWFAAVKRSAVGIKVWKYGMTIDDYCWNGRRIVLLNSHRWTKTNVPFWDFCCHIDQQITWNACCGPPAWSYRRFTEGKFVWAGPAGLAQRTPELTFYARGDGFTSRKAKVD
jgi:hypothetical protein